jgi:hypothetical protein
MTSTPTMHHSTPRLGLLRTLFLLVTFASVFTSLAFGQAISGNLLGTVTDSSGAAVTTATVEALNVGTGVTVATSTSSIGVYRFDNLPVATYRISVKASGFRTMVEEVDVVLNRTSTLNITLTAGAASETIEVSGVAVTLDTSTAQLQSTYNNRMSEDIGLTSAGGTGAGVLNLSLLSPGVTQASALGMGVGPSVGGQRPRNNNFTVEGVDNNNKSVTGALISVPNDAVESFTLLENQFNTEFGHSSGGQFNTTIKSGTNSFHGSLYEYFRNRDLNAVDNFYALQGLKSNPRFDSNRYGATFGGPILKNKLFFFSNFERQPVGLTGTSGAQVLAPTSAALQAISTDPHLSATNFGIFKKYVPVAPAGGKCIPYSTQKIAGEPFNAGLYNAPANGGCAAGSIDTGAVSISAPAFQNFENFVQSVDYSISDRDQIRGRYLFNKLDQIDTVANLPAFYTIQPYRWHLATVGEYHTFTPTIVNEFRVGFNRYDNTTPAGSFNYPGLDAFPNLVFNDLGGGLNVGPDKNAPQFTIQNFYQGVDNLSWNRGAHDLKFGVEWREYISPQNFTQRQRGDYEYNSTQLFLEDFSPDFFGERSSGSNIYYGNQQAVYWYANDTWKVTRNLSVDLGVRYEYTTLPISESQQSLNSLSNTPSVTVFAVNQPLLFNKPQVPKNNWAPRVGFAYSPGTSGTTSIRGGFGMAYDVLYDNIGILAVPPQLGATNDVNTGVAATPNFLGSGGLSGGGSGVKVLSQTTARATTSNWIPSQLKWPYSLNWNFGVQHSFGKDYTAEVRYVGTRGNHLDVQDRIDKQAKITNSVFLPTYLQQPSQAALDALPNTLDAISGTSNTVPAFSSAGFKSAITADLPLGWSTYHGLQTNLTRRFSNGLMLQAAYTWSRVIDNSTADFFSTYLTPRRPEDFQNWKQEKSVSALSRTHRLTLAAVYDLPLFKNSNWFMKNVAGNWSFSPVYVYESPEWATVESGLDSNLNGDFAGDRTIVNPAGTNGVGSGVTPLVNTGGHVVAYLANNPNARYIVAGAGALATGDRNTLATRPTNDFDLGTYKDISITERMKIRFGAQFANILNHAQYIPGSNPGQGLGVNDVNGFNTTSQSYLSYVEAGNANFNRPQTVFASNSRTIALVAKFTF